jgi:cation transport ATPase
MLNNKNNFKFLYFFLIIIGYRYYRAAFLGAINGNFGMDCLVVTGTTVTFVYSLTQLYLACEASRPTKHVFFEVSGMYVYIHLCMHSTISIRV